MLRSTNTTRISTLRWRLCARRIVAYISLPCYILLSYIHFSAVCRNAYSTNRRKFRSPVPSRHVKSCVVRARKTNVYRRRETLIQTLGNFNKSTRNKSREKRTERKITTDRLTRAYSKQPLTYFHWLTATDTFAIHSDKCNIYRATFHTPVRRVTADVEGANSPSCCWIFH